VRKTLMVIATATAFIGTPALAVPLTPAHSWAGCYVGLNGGYGWNNGTSSYQDPNTIGDPINFLPAFAGTPVAYISTPSGTSGSGGIVGGTGGCNFQRQQWIVGFEADMDRVHISGSSNTSVLSGPAAQIELAPGAYTAPNTLGTASEQINLQWLSTIRARGGLLVSDRLLLFATGGLAFGGINGQGSVNIFQGATPSSGSSVVWSGSTTAIRVGGVVGGGIEWALSSPITVKAEYLFYTFGNVSHPLNCSSENGVAPCLNDVFPTLGSADSSIFGSILRVGINYKF
jgi:outer membrane immunogenic protein